jgi:DASS family divalent anion:Na+ symporter
VLVLVFLFSHYMFASVTAHVSAMMLAFMTVGAALVPAAYLIPFLLLMTASSSIMMTLTHYATGTSPIIFGSGYISMGKWWSMGFIMAVFELLIYSSIGLLWWNLLGLW